MQQGGEWEGYYEDEFGLHDGDEVSGGGKKN